MTGGAKTYISSPLSYVQKSLAKFINQFLEIETLSFKF